MIPVKIIKNIYIRKGPGRGYESLGNVLPSGKVINMEGTVTGESYQGISNWYFLTNTNGVKQYYWGGGVEEGIDYNATLDIPSAWKNSKGQEINIAILDTGCTNHAALNNAIVASYNAVNKSNNVDDVSDNSHGTFVAGLIGARGSLRITGVAPKVNLIIVKVADNDIGILGEDVLEGLNWLVNKCPIKPHVVNISLDFDPFPNQQKFLQLFQQMRDANITTVAAGQNDVELITNHIFYPALESEVIGIGAISSDSSLFLNDDYKKIKPAIKYVLPNIDYYSTGKSDTYISNKGCSFSSAISAGIIALIYSLIGKSATFSTVVDTMNSKLNKLDNAIENNLKIYRV